MHTERVDRLISVIKYAVENEIELDENSSDIFEKLQIEREIIPKIKMADENDYGVTSIYETIDQGLLQKALDIYNERFGKKLTWVYNTRGLEDEKFELRVARKKSDLLRMKGATLFASLDDLEKYLSDLEILKEGGNITDRQKHLLEDAIANTNNRINNIKDMNANPAGSGLLRE